MTYEQYWYGDPLMVRAYYQANKLQNDRKDREAWLNGLYVLAALDASVGNYFRKEGTTPAEYPDEPLSMQRNRELDEKRAREREEQEALIAKAWMANFVQVGKRWEKEG